MSLTRYEFEILSYIEKKGKKKYSIRDISDDICVSETQILKSMDDLIQEKLLYKKESSIWITDKGVEKLEPYRVKKAIILAAGFGSRLMPATADRPKPLVTINSVRIIDTLLDALIKVGITDITIVRGYKKEKFNELLEKYPNICMIDNDNFEKTNNISSVLLAMDKLKGGCYLCEADLYIRNPSIISKYHYTSNILGSYSLETDDWSFRLEDGHISDYQKGNTFCYNYYGISYWTPEDCEKLRDDFQTIWVSPKGPNYFWEFVPLVIKKEKYAVEIKQCQKQDIIEIDNYYELVQLDSSYVN